MPYVFWWSGRGYITLLILLGTLAVFGLMLQAARPLIPDRPWFWGAGLLVAATLNWHFGSRINSRKRAASRPKNTWDRVFYRAHHRFMSLPMETFSGVIALAGVAAIVYSLIA